MTQIIKSIVATGLFLLYPYLVYKGMESGLVWVAPTIFSGLYLIQSFTTRDIKIKLYKVGISITLLLGAFYLQTLTAKLLPVFIQLMLMYFFGRTLLNDQGPPFIERFVRLEFPEFPPGISEYCRQLTILWTCFFAFNVIMSSGLAFWANDWWWTLYNGLIIYLLIGGLMIGEYIYRHFRFPDLAIPDAKSTIKTMVMNGRKIWMDVQK